MKEEAKTYEELIRKKRCIDITKYYELDENDLETIYNFLKENKEAVIRGGIENLVLTCKGKENQIIVSRKKTSTIDGVTVSNNLFKIIPCILVITFSLSTSQNIAHFPIVPSAEKTISPFFNNSNSFLLPK